MSKSNLHALSQPEQTHNDPLHELIRQGVSNVNYSGRSATIILAG